MPQGFSGINKLLSQNTTVDLPAEEDQNTLISNSAHMDFSEKDTVSKPPKKTRRNNKIMGYSFVILFVAIIIIGFVCYVPSGTMAWLITEHNAVAYRNYIHRYPQSAFRQEAAQRLDVLMNNAFNSLSRPFNSREVKKFLADFPEYDSSKMDTLFFLEAEKANNISYLRDYLLTFPQGKFANDATKLIREKEFELWEKHKNSNDENSLTHLLSIIQTPEIQVKIKNRINDLYRNFHFVSQKNTKEAYLRFIELEPNKPEAKIAQKKLIDLEVTEISAGEFGTLPASSPVSYSYGTTAEIELKNDTPYTLTVRYSGQESLKTILYAREKKTVTLPVGEYQIAVSAEGRNIRPFYGTNQIQAGRYVESFYIQSYRKY